MRRSWCLTVSAFVLGFSVLTNAYGAAGDFTTWTQVQDPADSHFTSSASSTQAQLFATGGPVPGATDIGYQSINGADVASSSQGFYFSKSNSVSLAIDFSATGSNQSGTLGIGFGIGEGEDGANSAGVAMLIQNGSPLAYGAAARVGDVNQTASFLGLGSSSGTLFVSYDQTTGDVTVGDAATTGALSPTASYTYSALEHSWAGDDLLASFFLRSDSTLGSPWASGNETATFSNFRVLGGSATAVPEPASLALLCGGLMIVRRRRPA